MPRALHFPSIELWPTARVLLRDGRPFPLGARAFDTLLALVEAAGNLVTKGELLDRAWPGLIVEEANIHVQVSLLRKLQGPDAIATVPGLGYRFARAVGTSGHPQRRTGRWRVARVGELHEASIGRRESAVSEHTDGIRMQVVRGRDRHGNRRPRGRKGDYERDPARAF